MSRAPADSQGMVLIGMFDSPFVRRVAISLTLLGHAFAHRDWSVGRDFDRIRQYNPLGRVPVLVLESGEALIESATILDFIDDAAGPANALLPATGAPRREALRIMALATGAVEKGLQQVIERVFRPEEKRHAPWLQRCRTQVHGALVELDRVCAAAGERDWLVGERMTQADITLGCFVTYVHEAVPLALDDVPALRARVARYEALDVFRRFHVPFDAPVPTTQAPA